MKRRLTLSIGFLILSMVAVVISMYGNLNGKWPDLLLNFGTEIAGIVITILLIYQYLEKREQLQHEELKLALKALTKLDQYVWVWQGGAREFDLVETLVLLRHVTNTDPLPGFTRGLLSELGSDASKALRYKPDVLVSNKELVKAQQALERLTDLWDETAKISCREVADHLIEALLSLAKVAKEPIELSSIDDESINRDTSIENQKRRYSMIRGKSSA